MTTLGPLNIGYGCVTSRHCETPGSVSDSFANS